MAPLIRPKETEHLLLPERRAILGGNADVLVVGGGPAGLGAALGAADAGCSVILAERYGFLGGNATAALVMPLMSFYTQGKVVKPSRALTLAPADHGVGESMIAGVLGRLVSRLVAAGGALSPSSETGFTVPFDPEIFKQTAAEMLDEAGVSLLFHAFASTYLEEGGAPAAAFETKSGPVAIRARVIVDCTGDGDIAAQAGADYELGREEDGLVQPMTLLFRIVGFARERFGGYVKEHPDQWSGVNGLQDLIRKAAAAGELNLTREDILFFGGIHQDEVAVNSTRVARVLGTDVWDLSYAEWESRKQMKSIVQFLKKYVPGFEDSYLVQSGTTVGIRETRRILGRYYITAEDLLSGRRFPDAIARGTYPVDIHNPSGKGTMLKHLPPGQWYELPLRALLPINLDSVIVAGRCISGSHEAHSAYRVMPTSMATGQAAGVCAALAARSRVKPSAVPYEAVRGELLRQGAIL